MENWTDYLKTLDLNISEVNKLYALIKTEKGNLYLSDKKPINPAMATDFYQLATVAAFLENGIAHDMTTFSSFFRSNPFGGGFAIFVGLQDVIEFLQNFQYTGEDIDDLRSMYKFPPILWEYLREARFNGILEAPLEGSVVGPHVPLTQTTVERAMQNLIESQILALTGYQTVIATKAARTTLAVKEPWVEFALRGCPDIETSLKVARAAYIGGSSGTSNVLANQILNIPAGGTMPHNFPMSFPVHRDGIKAWMKVFGEDSAVIIDTYDYMEGTKDAVSVAKELGLETFKAVRDDSGDLAAHSIKIREYLDSNDFKKVKIFASNSLTAEKRIALRKAGAKIDVDGIGRSVALAEDSGMVFKLMQSVDKDGNVLYAIKLSGDEGKITDPGRKKVSRLTVCTHNKYKYKRDLMSLYGMETDVREVYDRSSGCRGDNIGGGSCLTVYFNVLKTVMSPSVSGNMITHLNKREVDQIRSYTKTELSMMPDSVLDLDNPSKYPLFLDSNLNRLKNKMIKERR